MKCKCKKMRIRTPGYRSDSNFDKFPEIKKVDEGWRSILQCPNCDQYWLVDEFDKVQHLWAIKVDHPDKPEEKDLFELHKTSLEKSRGGYSQEQCRMAECNNAALNNSAYCADCCIIKHGVYE